MTETNANASAIYKVGDKVRILNVDGIMFGDMYWENGDVAEVVRLKANGSIYVTTTKSGLGHFAVTRQELRYIKKVADKPTKNQRILALESEVSALKAEVEALKQAHGKAGKLRILAVDPSVTNVAPIPIPTPNELRKAIIAEARAFVEDVETKIKDRSNDGHFGEFGQVTPKLGVYILRVKYVINPAKRTVVALAIPFYCDDHMVCGKGIAKCAPGDVFNADIGKAIALGRALGLDVSKFEQAVQPTELAVAQKCVIRNWAGHNGNELTITKLLDGNRANHSYTFGWLGLDSLKITDDTEAQYE